ncbi:Acyl-coenzyme A thioesterase 11 [Nowakowskiella sp. JEL0407]|nr:Acyl-coenzyme A thioesterase 11 [Nowakowskiella sp. JEL0407]
MAELHAHNMYPNENFTTKSNPRIKYPYAERNKDSILTTMTPYLLQCKRVLELASGSGQHISYIAEKFPEIQFQPSEIPDEKLHASINSYIAELSNVKKPIALDALNETDWEKLTGENVDLVYFVNLLHISSWRVTEMVSKNVSELLESGGWCIVYGPFKKDGKFTTESNEEFFNFSIRKNVKLVENSENLTPKTVQNSRTTMTEMIRTEHTDTRGLAYGGSIMAWIDVCAGVAAKRHAGKPCVTASVDSVHFLGQVKLGDIVVLRAFVNRTWRSSLEIEVRVDSEDMITGKSRYCCQAYLTFVAVKDGKSVPVPGLIPESDAEKRRYEEAEIRRNARIQQKKISPLKGFIISPNQEQVANVSAFPSTNTPRKESVIAPLPSPTRAVMEEYDENIDLKNEPDFGTQSEDDYMKVGKIFGTCAESYTEIVQIVFPEHANSLGITFGGQIMRWMEYCSVMSASRHTRSHLLTASIDSLNFLLPTRIGDIVIVRSVLSAAFTNSVEVYVTVEVEDEHGNRKLTNDGWITQVSVNHEGKIIPVPKLITESVSEIERNKNCMDRREKRLYERKLVKSKRK